MGLLDIFRRKPAWQKNCKNAQEEIRSADDPELILQVVNETAFGERETETLALLAADRLWELRDGKSGAKKRLEHLAREASSPIARCHAAFYLRSRDGMKKWVEENIIAAYKRLDTDIHSKPKDAAAWIECVEDEATLVAAFDAACRLGNFRFEVYDHLHGKSLLTKLFWNVKDERVQEELLGHVDGSRAEYERIVRESKSPRCVTAAIHHLDAVSLVLRQLAEQGNGVAFWRFRELGKENMLVELADGGNLKAQEYLISANKRKYEKRYETSLRNDLRDRAMAASTNSLDGAKLVEEAVRKGLLPEEKLEEIALTRPLGGMSGLPWIALRQIEDSDRLARLLLERKCGTGFSTSRREWNAWGEELVGRLWNREDALLRCILETDYHADVKRKALKLIKDPDKLLQIAMSDHWLAPEAARLLPKKKLAPVRNSKDSRAAKLGQEQHYRNRVSRAGEAELREILDWTLQNSDSPDLYLKALARVEDQPALLDVLRAWLGAGRRYGNGEKDKPWKNVGQAILERITDGAGLASVCLEKPNAVDAGIAAHLKALIGGSEAEARFAEGARQWMLENPYNWQRGASMLRLYYDLPDDWQALWRFGGPEFVRRVLEELQGAKEYMTAMGLGRILADLYRNMPESHASLNSVRDRRYTKHMDIVSNCASENENYNKEYVLELK